MAPISLSHIRQTNDTLLNNQPLVAVFVGATSGIGEYSVRALAATHGTTGAGLRLYLVGRNAVAAEKVFADCRRLCPAGKFVFVQADDLALLKNIDVVASEIIKLENEEAGKTGEASRIDFLVMCQGIAKFDGRDDTKEGLDTIMSLFYYSRMRLIVQLLPLLLASTQPTGSRIISVLGAGNAKAGRDKITPDDLSLRNPKNFGFIALGDQIAYMKTFFFEDLAAKHPGKLSLIHYFPGLVWTPAFDDKKLPFWFRAAITLAKPVLNLAGPVVGKEETGERMLFLLSERYPARSVNGKESIVEKGKRGEIGVAMGSDGMVGGGAYRIMYTGEMIPTVPEYEMHRKEGLPKKCLEHTFKAFADIESGKVFKD